MRPATARHMRKATVRLCDERGVPGVVLNFVDGAVAEAAAAEPGDIEESIDAAEFARGTGRPRCRRSGVG